MFTLTYLLTSLDMIGEKLVVGAQYSLEDMLAKERNKPVKYYDDEHKMKQLAEETKGMMNLLETTASRPVASAAGTTTATVDLLDVGTSVGNASDPFAGTTDLLGTSADANAQSRNLIEPSFSAANSSKKGGGRPGTDDLLDVFTTAATISAPPAAPIGMPPMPAEPPPPPPAQEQHVDPFAGL